MPEPIPPAAETAAPSPAALAPYIRDDPRYWDARPDDHTGDGLYRDGPHEARPSFATLVPSGPGRGALSPAVARAQRQLAEARAAARVTRAAERAAALEASRAAAKRARRLDALRLALGAPTLTGPRRRAG